MSSGPAFVRKDGMRFLSLFLVVAALAAGCSSAPEEGAVTSAEASPTTTAVEVTQPASAGVPATDETVPAAGRSLGELLAGSLRATTDASARWELGVELTGVPDLGALSFALSGAAEAGGEASQLTVDLTGLVRAAVAAGNVIEPELLALFDSPLEVIAIDQDLWLRWSALSVLTGQDLDWVGVPAQLLEAMAASSGGWDPFGAEDGDDLVVPGGGMSALPFDPSMTSPEAVLELLAGFDVPAQEVGADVVRGAATTRYRSSVELMDLFGLTPFAELLSSSDRAEVHEADDMVDTIAVELWIDDAGLLRRLEISSAVTDDDGETVTISVRFELFDVGGDIIIAPPDPARVTSVLELDLESLFGAMGPSF
jgi:hypothetical protein